MHESEQAPKISAATAAREAGVSKRTILYAIERGDLKATNVDGLGFIIRRADFRRYVAKREARLADSAPA